MTIKKTSLMLAGSRVRLALIERSLIELARESLIERSLIELARESLIERLLIELARESLIERLLIELARSRSSSACSSISWCGRPSSLPVACGSGAR